VDLKPILYADDDVNDAFFMKRAFAQAGIPNPLVIVSDGQEAMDYLSNTGLYADKASYPTPCLILIDINMPKESGIDVLRWLRTQPGIQVLPVIVVSSSTQDTDIQRAYFYGANSYLTKPGTPNELLALVKELGKYWLNINRTPQASVSPKNVSTTL
jgi:CheY-like chemotaxis protein